MRLACALLAALCGCGDDAAATVDAAGQLPTCAQPIIASLDNADAPRADSAGYLALDAGELMSLDQSIAAAIAGDTGSALTLAGDADYDLCEQGALLRWRPRQVGVGRATVVWRSAAARGLIVGAPHPQFETHTLDEAKQLFEQLPARALIVAGTHRCANPTASGCSGTTGVCGVSEPYRESDMAHATATGFHLAHERFSRAFAADLVVSLHGMGASGVSVSNGTTDTVAADSVVANLAAALRQQFPADNITTCNDYPGANVDVRLCGTTNAQGRMVNNSTDACSVAATGSSERFIHIEQSLDVREGRQKVVTAFDAVVP